jgi:hypothetical protein
MIKTTKVGISDEGFYHDFTHNQCGVCLLHPIRLSNEAVIRCVAYNLLLGLCPTHYCATDSDDVLTFSAWRNFTFIVGEWTRLNFFCFDYIRRAPSKYFFKAFTEIRGVFKTYSEGYIGNGSALFEQGQGSSQAVVTDELVR